MKDKKEAVELPERKPTFTYDVTDEEELKGYAIGDVCLITAKGKVSSANKHTFTDESDRVKGSLTFELKDIEIEKTSGEDQKEADDLDIDLKDQNEMKKLREKKKNEPKSNE